MSELLATSPQPKPAAAPPRRSLSQNILTACACITASLIILIAARWDYAQALQFTLLRTDCLIAGIAAGLGATICLAGAMYYFDRAARLAPRWYWRILLAAAIRLLMFLQLATMALAIGAAALMIFSKPIPGTVPAPPQSAATRAPTRSPPPRPSPSQTGRGRRGGRAF